MTELHNRRNQNDRRTRVPRPCLNERRTGFDRRLKHPILGAFRDDPRSLLILLAVFVALSLADGALTSYELSRELATEGNPVMAALIEAHPVLAASFKVVLTALVALAIWQGRRYRRILAVGVFALLVYGALMVYHLRGLSIAMFA